MSAPSCLESTPLPMVEMSGIEIANLCMEEAVAAVVDLARKPSPHLIFTPNLQHLRMLGTDKDFALAYDSADLRLADGMPLLWLSKNFHGKKPLKARVAGSDIEPRIHTYLQTSIQSGTVVYVGGTDQANDLAVRNRKREFPNLRFTGIKPSFSYSRDPKESSRVISELHTIVSDASEQEPVVVYFCTGSPKSEIWLHQNKNALPRGAYISAGAVVDFAAGLKNRAPTIMQMTGLEWLYRLSQEPTRLAPRYMRDAAYLIREVTRA